ncbi:uncharacterized protein M6B38_260355 [Iris pallida]|uniref:Uncharacterized protein n=1 Tax=Iris pallida TaxID=29817 RepID=A0AAX6DPQ0_IRIPA|nr:Uncharacterized protein M6B38_235025 [Iris pallida]KAJ6851763.1 uncharacterized protein M6B38_260355 [Iris pallida]
MAEEGKSTTVAAGGEERSRGKSKSKEEEEILKSVDKVIRKSRNPDTFRYVEKKLEDKGIHRRDRHPNDGLGVHHGPPKSGHGGKFTWEGPAAEAENELDPAPAAIDPGDPNYVVDDEQEDELVIGEVEVAKVVEPKKAVARIEVHPPLTPN